MDDFDKEIKLIEAFIKFFEVNYSRKLKNLVRMDNEKYKEIIRQKLFVIDEKEYPKLED
jgi:cobalamin biosynthesis Co2+ chelatase CbiK